VTRLKQELGQLNVRMQEDLESQQFYHLGSDRQHYFDGSWLEKFPFNEGFNKAGVQLICAGRCFAFDQTDAAVFHSMKALELGLQALAAKFEVDFKYENWQNVIDQIESDIKRLGKSPKKSRDQAELKGCSEAATNFTFLKDAWRNHVMHARESYGDESARSILSHAREFVEKLPNIGLREHH